MAVALELIFLIGKYLAPVPYPPARLQGLIVRLIPGKLATASIEALEHWAMRGLALGLHVAALAGGALIVLAIARGGTARGRARRALGVAAATFVASSLLGLAAGGASLFALPVYAGAALLLVRLAGAPPFTAALEPDLQESETPLDAIRRSRRRFLGRLATGVAAGGGLAALAARGLLRHQAPAQIAAPARPFVPPLPDPAFPAVSGLSREITPVKDFYVVDIDFVKPSVDAVSWRLQVAGAVRGPYALTFEELQREFEVVELAHTLTCISNQVGGHLISTAVWRGVRLADLLARAGLETGVVDVAFQAADSYVDSIPLEKAIEPTTLVVFGMNGLPLTREHGFPARIIVPGIYGMKNVKWLTSIEAATDDVRGYWQKRGWSDVARVKTQSRIDVPGSAQTRKSPLTAAGVAWAGDRRISSVEVSDDGGQTWRRAQLERELSPVAWRLWAAEVAGRGDARLMVRATDGSGAVQEGRHTRPHPDGASGRHAVSFELE
ncbi:MAG: molybdopterin-dependent oxidoreductase [Actinomycetota bacterium]